MMYLRGNLVPLDCPMQEINEEEDKYDKHLKR